LNNSAAFGGNFSTTTNPMSSSTGPIEPSAMTASMIAAAASGGRSSTMRGFLVMYDGRHNNFNHDALVRDAISVLDKYADKLYRTPVGTCTMMERLVGDANASPIFIACEMPDPSVLTEAIYTDLMSPYQCDEYDKLKQFTKIFPVHVSTLNADDIVQTAKDLMEPVLEDGSVKTMRIEIKNKDKWCRHICFHALKAVAATKNVELEKNQEVVCTISKSYQITLTENGVGMLKPIVFVIFLKRFLTFKQYSIPTILDSNGFAHSVVHTAGSGRQPQPSQRLHKGNRHNFYSGPAYQYMVPRR